MVLHVCGESISVPIYISNWAEENENNKIELQGMVESIVWAAKKGIAKDTIDSSKKEYSDGLNEFLSAYKDLMGSLFSNNDSDDKDKNK